MQLINSTKVRLQNPTDDWHQLVWHAWLIKLLQDCEASFLIDRVQVFLGAHNTEVLFVTSELFVLCCVVFDEDETSLTVFCFVEPIQFTLLEEVNEVCVRQVANNPLYPNAIVLMLKYVLLHALTEELSRLLVLFLRLLQLCFSRL